MQGLMQLLNHRSDAVVAQAVLVLKQLLQMPYYQNPDKEDKEYIHQHTLHMNTHFYTSS